MLLHTGLEVTPSHSTISLETVLPICALMPAYLLNWRRSSLDFPKPADVLVPNWSLSHPATFDLKVIHPLNTHLILEASLASGNSAESGEVGKHSKNDEMCSRLG